MSNKNIPENIERIMNTAAAISHYYSNASDAEYKKYPKAKADFEKKYGKGSFGLYVDLYWEQDNYETKYKKQIEGLKMNSNQQKDFNVRKGFEKQWDELVRANQDPLNKGIIDFVKDVSKELDKDINGLTEKKFNEVVEKHPTYGSFSGAAYSMAKMTLYGYWQGSWKLKEVFPEDYANFEKHNPDFKWEKQKER